MGSILSQGNPRLRVQSRVQASVIPVLAHTGSNKSMLLSSVDISLSPFLSLKAMNLDEDF